MVQCTLCSQYILPSLDNVAHPLMCQVVFVVVIVYSSPMATWFLILVWKRSRAGGGGGGLWCSPQPCLLFIYIMHCCCWSIVGCRVAVFDVAPAFRVRKWEGRGCCSPKIMGTVTTTGVVTIWMTWHVCWQARSSPWAIMLLPAGDVATPCCCC